MHRAKTEIEIADVYQRIHIYIYFFHLRPFAGWPTRCQFVYLMLEIHPKFGNILCIRALIHRYMHCGQFKTRYSFIADDNWVKNKKIITFRHKFGLFIYIDNNDTNTNVLMENLLNYNVNCLLIHTNRNHLQINEKRFKRTH